MKAYKGFNKDMTCRGFQFKEGETYETDTVKLCESGFHACEMPLDCFRYYAPADSEYHEVELEDVSPERGEDTKVCAKRIKIGAKLDIAGIVKAQIEYANEHTGKSNAKHATGDYGAASATGNYGAASATGKDSIALAAGYQSKAKASLGSAICICERGGWNGETYPLLAVKAAIIDGEVLKPDTWYTLKDGEFKEVTE